MTRDEVFQEFTRWTDWPNTTRTIHQTHWYDTDAMADEIVRLRKQFEIATSMLSSQARMINQMHDILDRLREPSEKVLLAAVEAVPYGASYAALMHCIPAAVAAAGQEVRHDEA